MSRVRFVVDREIDITNHFIALGAYKKRKDRDFSQRRNEWAERVLVLPRRRQRKEIEKRIQDAYLQKGKLRALAGDINVEWEKLEKKIIQTLERVHEGHPFPAKAVKGVLSSADRFGYNVEEKWFAVNMYANKFAAIDTALHELMHFMFHTYYDDFCKKQGLTAEEMWDVKESFTGLLNGEFKGFRFTQDFGYAPHKAIRAFILKTWPKTKNFTKTLEATIHFVKKNRNKIDSH